jgi:hypothetical protein
MLMRLRFVLAARRCDCEANRLCCEAFFLVTVELNEQNQLEPKNQAHTCIFQPTPKVPHYDDGKDECDK